MSDLPPYTVAVRALCEFTARRGDLDLRMTPAPTAQQGIAGHQWVAARRGASYETEIALQGHWQQLTVRGRADGFDAALGRLEEIKTHRGDLARQPANHRHLHWAQLKVYGWLFCQARSLDAIRLALVYLDVGTQEETVLEETHDAASLRAFFEDQCGRFIAWARQEAAHRTRRDDSLQALQFPHPAFRPGQRELAESVWRAATRGHCLMAQAPTGIGKTVATLFPVLKAVPAQRLDRVFFLSAKTPGRQLALDALGRLAQGQEAASPPHLRSLELVARDKACEHPDKECHGDSCPLARGFYDRLPAARAQAVSAAEACAMQTPRDEPRLAHAHRLLDAATLRGVAAAHQVCPYWLGQELARWCDVVVGDYNHYFDTSALLHALTLEHEWRCTLLVDEAHNLIERGRQMYSGQLDEWQLRGVRTHAPASLKKPLEKLARHWREAVRGQEADYAVHDRLPDRFIHSLQQAASAIADHLADPQDSDSSGRGELQQFYFDALAFTRLAERFGDHSLFDVTRTAGRGRPSTVLCIRNLLPAPHLAPRFEATHATVLFSATLGPDRFHRDMLGLPPAASWLEVDSPFEARQLEVRLVPRISTRWADRARSVAPIADLIASQYERQPGNYLAFFSSYDYLQSVARQLAAQAPGLPLWTQSAGMSESDRRAFIERFTPGGRGVGFAVLGGSFGEGIDLPGDRLVGAFIATLGLPQVNPVNELLRQRMQQAFGAGFDYAYLYPGLRKVVQAAGRVIRTPQDRGIVYLIDDRFCRSEVRALFPRWWAPAVHA